MQRQIVSPASDGSHAATRRPVGVPARPLTAVQESVFFAVIFAIGLLLQLAAVLMQASALG